MKCITAKHFFYLIMILLLIPPSNGANFEYDEGTVQYSDKLKVGDTFKWVYKIENDTFVYNDNNDKVTIEIQDLEKSVTYDYDINRFPQIFINQDEFSSNFKISSTYETPYVSHTAMILPVFYNPYNGSQETMFSVLNTLYSRLYGSVVLENDIIQIKYGGTANQLIQYNATTGVLMYYRYQNEQPDKGKSLEIILQESDNSNDASLLGLPLNELSYIFGFSFGIIILLRRRHNIC